MANDADINPTELAGFFQFLQCQLRMEARLCLDEQVTLLDPGAEKLWETYVKWKGGSSREKWMPYHTVLGLHELFIVTALRFPDSKRTFLAMFIFRSTCKPDMFDAVQRPFLEQESFWQDPVKCFNKGGDIYREMLAYRRRGAFKQPLQTSTFRCIPGRLLDDDDENLVLNICKRTQTLLRVAEAVWPILHDPHPNKFERISKEIQRGEGLGDTWSKMLMVSMDIMFPDKELLCNQCDVGIGAFPGLQRILKVQESESKVGLERLTVAMNMSTLASAAHFREVLPRVEQLARQKYRQYPNILSHMGSDKAIVTASTVQVQLCEWRQFLGQGPQRVHSADAPKRPASLSVDSLRSSTAGGPLNGFEDAVQVYRRADDLLSNRELVLRRHYDEAVGISAEVLKADREASAHEQATKHVKRSCGMLLRDAEMELLDAESDLRPLQITASRLKKSYDFLSDQVNRVLFQKTEQLLSDFKLAEGQEGPVTKALAVLLPQAPWDAVAKEEEREAAASPATPASGRDDLRGLQLNLSRERQRFQEGLAKVREQKAKVDTLAEKRQAADRNLRSAEEEHREAMRRKACTSGELHKAELEEDHAKWKLKMTCSHRSTMQALARYAARARQTDAMDVEE